MTAVGTPVGRAEVRLEVPEGVPAALLLLGHGAGGGVDSADLAEVTSTAVAAGYAVARVTQPYRVAGRRSPPRAEVLDEAWRAVVPPHLAAESRVESLRGGRLTIRVASAATRYVLARNLARTIPDALRARLPDIRISRIDYIVGALDNA